LCNQLARFNIAVMGSDGLTAWVPAENEAVALMILTSQPLPLTRLPRLASAGEAEIVPYMFRIMP